MKLHFILTVEGDPVLLRKIATIQGVANSLGLPMTMQPEEEQEPARKALVRWGAVYDAEDVRDLKLHDAGKKVLKEGETLPRKEFVRTLAAASKKEPKTVGIVVAKWLRAGVLEEVA